MATKTARLVARNAHPVFTHDCEACRFVGRLDAEDLYVCSNGDFLRRFGSEPHENGSLGTLAPEGSPYSLILAIVTRGLPPRVYTTR